MKNLIELPGKVGDEVIVLQDFRHDGRDSRSFRKGEKFILSHWWNSPDDTIGIRGYGSVLNKKYFGLTSQLGKIIGYKSPVGMFLKAVPIPKDTIFVPVSDNTEFYFGKTGDDRHRNTGYWLPKELVEIWEPVYESKGFKKGEYVVIESSTLTLSAYHVGGVYQLRENFSPAEPHAFLTALDDNGSTTNGYESSSADFFERIRVRAATPEEIEQYQSIEVLGYHAKFGKDLVSFGCQTLSKEQVEVVHDLVNRPGAKFTLSVDGKEIPRDMINKVFKRLQ